MDFSSQLSNLEQTAAAAAASGSDNNNNNNNRSYYNNNRQGRGRGFDRTRRRPQHDGSYYGRPNQRPRRENNMSPNNNTNDGPLGEMKRYGYNVEPYKPQESATASSSSYTSKHIALLVISIDDLPFEHIWRAWADDNTTNSNVKVSLLCHAKYPEKVKSEWLRRRLLQRPPKMGRGNSLAEPEFLTYRPEWGSVQITRAMKELLKQALNIGTTNTKDYEKDPRFSNRRFAMQQDTTETPVDMFLFVSETCLPVTTLEETYDAFFQDDNRYSWVNARSQNSPDTPKNKYERDQFAGIHRMVPQSMRWKADQWLALSRAHAKAVIDIDCRCPRQQLWSAAFSRINASDEMYFPTCLSLLEILRKSSPQVKLRPVTYTDWTQGMRNPACFTKGATDFARVARSARRQGSLVARKFEAVEKLPSGEQKLTGEIKVDEWKDELEKIRKEEQLLKDKMGNGTKNEGSKQDDDNPVESPPVDEPSEKAEAEPEATEDGTPSEAPAEAPTEAASEEEESPDAVEESKPGGEDDKTDESSDEAELDDNLDGGIFG